MEVKQHAGRLRSNTQGETCEGDDKIGRVVQENTGETPENVIGGAAK